MSGVKVFYIVNAVPVCQSSKYMIQYIMVTNSSYNQVTEKQQYKGLCIPINLPEGETMFRIGICDDSSIDRGRIKEISGEYMSGRGISHEFVEFTKGEELVEYCKNPDAGEINLLFLDIEMEEMDGIKVKDKMVNESGVRRIIFVTSHADKMPMAFGLKVVAFIKKPIDVSCMERHLGSIVQEWEENIQVTYEGLKGLENIEIENIRYIKAVKDYTYLYIVGSRDYIWTKYRLKQWEEKLSGKAFVRVHRSYFANLQHITKMKSDVTIRGEEKPIPLGREYRDEAKKAYMAYVMKKVDRI